MYRVAAPAGVHGVANLPPTLPPRRCASHASLALLRVFVCAVCSCVAQTPTRHPQNVALPVLILAVRQPGFSPDIYRCGALLCCAVLRLLSINIIFLVDCHSLPMLGVGITSTDKRIKHHENVFFCMLHPRWLASLPC